MLNVEQWCEVLRQYPTAKEKALQILKGIDGYGTECYCFDEDSENLLNALKAFWILQEHERQHEKAKAWNQACDLVINDLLREYYTDGETIKINPKKLLPGK